MRNFRHIFSPWIVTIGVWVIIFLIYLFAKDELYALPDNFLVGVTLWISFFCATSYAAYRLTPRYEAPAWRVCERHVNLLLVLAIILVPVAVVKAVQQALLLASPADLAVALREQAITPEENQMGVVKYFVYIINVLLMIELDRDVWKKKRIVILVVLSALFFVATMAKLTLFTFLFSSIYILYCKNRIKLKHIAIVAFSLIALIPIMYFMRSDSAATSTLTVGNLILIYMVSSMIAFGYISPASSHLWGEATFRPFYHILQVLGFNYSPSESLQDFVAVPLPTNVYTVMFPYYKDFGMVGIVAFAILEGILIGFVYKKSLTGCNILKYLYAYIFTMLMLQFFDEQIFQGFSSILQTIIIILFCHVSLRLKKGASA